jgi:DNA glycosylase AlkZ-like
VPRPRTAPTLTTRRLNRALLARQLLLDRSRLPLPRVLEQLGGLQAQYAPSAYIRLASCLETFTLADLTQALERRRAVQGTLMRSTIHIVSPRDYWQFAVGIGQSRQDWWLTTHGRDQPDADVNAIAQHLRSELAGRTWQRRELDALLRAYGSNIWEGVWIELVRVPPSGTWERRRADLFKLAAEWLPPRDVSKAEGLLHVLRRYLAGFGPARLTEAASWAGVPVAKLRPPAERLRLRRFQDEEGKELLDVPRAPLPAEETAAPVRFLPTWDATLLVHARRTQILPERFRSLVFSTKTPHSVATFLVDGAVAGTWRFERSGKKATLLVEPYEPLPRALRNALSGEGARLVRILEPDALSYAVRVSRRTG